MLACIWQSYPTYRYVARSENLVLPANCARLNIDAKALHWPHDGRNVTPGAKQNKVPCGMRAVHAGTFAVISPLPCMHACVMRPFAMHGGLTGPTGGNWETGGDH